MQDEIGAMIERPHQYRRREGGIDQQGKTGRMRNLRDCRNIEHLETGIADGLCKDEPSLRLDGGAEGSDIARWHEGCRDAKAWQSQLQHVEAAAIQCLRGNDMTAATHQGGNGEMQSRMTTCRRDRTDTAIECGDALFQHSDGRIADTAVDVTGSLEIEQRRGMIAVIEDVRCRLIDRHRASTGGGINLLATMQTQRFRAGKFGL